MSYQLPLGPFDQTWRGPLRIVLHADGERISDVEHHDGFHARGCAENLCRLPLQQSYPLVNRVCGIHSHHHALAWTMALEQLARIEVPARAETLRALLAEAERIASHLHDAARMIALLGLDAVVQRLFRLRELALQAGQTLAGHRLVYDFVRPGGVQYDLHRDERGALQTLLTTISDELQKIMPSILARRGLVRRMSRLAVLKPELLDSLHIAGWIGRAAGLDTDVRHDQPYGIYAVVRPPVVVRTAGDARARLATLLAEAHESAEFLRQILLDLPEGRWRGDPLTAVPAGSATVSVEAPSGALTYRLTSDGAYLTEVNITVWQRPDRRLLRAALVGTLVDDAGLAISSLAFCTACIEA
ncbi:MAG TPA: nickel-dependent hydrogenase large subunit [Herpetosiphonaceae bacterium]|nr:nickel-dependent hydrogenase large subunit [Herpetosiphonaceae bacterium]